MNADPAPVMGVCRFCGCTEDNACRLPDGEPCGWVNKLRTLCSNWSCLARWGADKQRDARDRRKEVREFRGELYRRRREGQERRQKVARRKKSKGRAA